MDWFAYVAGGAVALFLYPLLAVLDWLPLNLPDAILTGFARRMPF